MRSETLKQVAARIRLGILDAVAGAKKGHIGGAFSCTDLLVALYHGGILRFDSSCPDWLDRDRFILGKGHSGVALYVVLADLGFFNPDELTRLNQGGLLGEHPDRNVPGVEVVSGSLGHGLGIGAGMALAAKMDHKDYRTVVLLGDGECYEGSVWEAANFSAHQGLDNLWAVVDRNNLIVNDFTENVNRLEPFADKWRAFGWDIRDANGHEIPEILETFSDFRTQSSGRPVVIIANTVKGKGVSFMENQVSWHHGGISGALYGQAKQELEQGLP